MPEEQGPSFAELLRVNQDVKAWLTLDHTQIDYPVLQGEDNFAYINTDVYGNFALAGSIFIDSRCDPSFADPYTLLHGHHMENSRMFGDLDLYKDLDFFRQYYTGTLRDPRPSVAPAGLRLHGRALRPRKKSSTPPFGKRMAIGRLLPFVKARSVALRRRHRGHAGGRHRRPAKRPRVIAMATCSSEYTDARTIVLAVMNDYGQENREDV